MKIGVDFDNTIINYDMVFNRAGCEMGLIPDNLEPGKNSVRDYLRRVGKEDDWTWLQGYVYGTQLHHAEPYRGVMDFFRFCDENSITACIISHKTRYPYAGDKHDLHRSARMWIENNGFSVDVYFEDTKTAKVDRINTLGCGIFIDDLPEFLSLPGFPAGLVKILFDPSGKQRVAGDAQGWLHAGSWEQVLEMTKPYISRTLS
ncbi:MAG TPA: hypothetical protein DHV36_23690 [Desulfobacteraceae bacterium]|nr:hypothetical protein [Desulfobacteraceae bacterium]|tara:strand:+ start:1283 stop:1891 length:609 start_codon:yes stop_codon:yes gene_type:complete